MGLFSLLKVCKPNKIDLRKTFARLSSSTLQAFNFVHKDTIYALSSGFGKCGVAMIRISGGTASEALYKMTKLKKPPKPRQSFVAPIFHPNKMCMLDRAMLIYFSSPNSFTGEDVCELHVHGGPAVVASVLDALSCIDGLRPAEAGEFTKRAFINNKLDLTEVEGLGDLIHAETEAQRRQALSQMEGSLSTIYQKWSNDLLQSLAHIEAYIDFSEDEQLEDDLLPTIIRHVKQLQRNICEHLDDRRRGERLRNGLKVVIAGEPNVGKSSLLNSVIRRPAAIVSPVAGTTRDVIDSVLDINGYPVILSDTAGLRESDDLVECEGVARAVGKLKEADIVVLMLDAEYFNKFASDGEVDIAKLTGAYCEKLKIDDVMAHNLDCKIVTVVNKIDLVPVNNNNDITCQGISFVSCRTEEGLVEFVNILSDNIKMLCDNIGESPSLTQQRHRQHLLNCMEYLSESVGLIENDVVIAAELLRFALNELGQISGKISSEQILDVVFKDFCIGK